MATHLCWGSCSGQSQRLTGVDPQSVYLSACQGSGSLPAHQVQVSGELAEVRVGFVPGLDLAEPNVGLRWHCFLFPCSSCSATGFWCWGGPKWLSICLSNLCRNLNFACVVFNWSWCDFGGCSGFSGSAPFAPGTTIGLRPLITHCRLLHHWLSLELLGIWILGTLLCCRSNFYSERQQKLYI